MKILTKEEEAAHYKATLKGGSIGGLLGLAAGAGSVWFASRRFPGFRGLTVPFRVFLVASTGTFASIIAADKASRRFEIENNAARLAFEQHVSEYDRFEQQKPFIQRAKDWAGENRYSIVFASWVASMGIALALVRRNPYLSGGQKLVQARVYAQGLTLAVLLASFGIEASDAARKKGRWETVKVLDPSDPTHQRMIEKRIHHERYEGEDQWMEIIAAEERKEKEREAKHQKEQQTARDAIKKADQRYQQKQQQ